MAPSSIFEKRDVVIRRSRPLVEGGHECSRVQQT
jgi:hypothetical protein